jgi:hypothetical protein
MLPWMVGHTWVGLPPDYGRPCPWFADTLLMDYRKAEVYTHAPWKRNTELSKGIQHAHPDKFSFHFDCAMSFYCLVVSDIAYENSVLDRFISTSRYTDISRIVSFEVFALSVCFHNIEPRVLGSTAVHQFCWAAILARVLLHYKYIDTEAGFATCYMYLNH